MGAGNRNSKRSVLLLKSGDVAPPLSLLAGDYDSWFAIAFGSTQAKLHLVQAHRNQKLPDPRQYDAVVMTGSPLSVTEPAPWMNRAAECMLGAAARGVPVLGVCFGHQLLARALGGQVVRNPKGRETGSVSISLTPAGQKDPLFFGIPTRFVAQATHGDIVLPGLEGMTVLAGNENTAVQAARFGQHLWGVQFHPELSAAGMRALVTARAAQLEADARARGDAAGRRVEVLLSGISPSLFGTRLLVNFLEHVC